MIEQGKRIVRPRRKGTPLPEGAIYVGRPTMWGNPFQDRAGGHARSVIVHAHWLDGKVGALMLENMGFTPAEVLALERLRRRVLTNLHRLASKDLACWCPQTSAWCHANTLLRLAPIYAEYESIAA